MRIIDDIIINGASSLIIIELLLIIWVVGSLPNQLVMVMAMVGEKIIPYLIIIHDWLD